MCRYCVGELGTPIIYCYYYFSHLKKRALFAQNCEITNENSRIATQHKRTLTPDTRETVKMTTSKENIPFFLLFLFVSEWMQQLATSNQPVNVTFCLAPSNLRKLRMAYTNKWQKSRGAIYGHWPMMFMAFTQFSTFRKCDAFNTYAIVWAPMQNDLVWCDAAAETRPKMILWLDAHRHYYFSWKCFIFLILFVVALHVLGEK